METFDNVTIGKVANVYFDGKVTSRAITLPSGEKKTLGIMLAGDYKFDTGVAELMEVSAGEVEIKLAGEETFTRYKAGESFNVPGDSFFELKVEKIFDYVCSYLD